MLSVYGTAKTPTPCRLMPDEWQDKIVKCDLHGPVPTGKEAAPSDESEEEQDPPEGWTAYLANAILAEHHFAKDPAGHLYRYKDGVYLSDGKNLVEKCCKEILGAEKPLKKWSTYRVNQVEAFISVDAPALWMRPPLNKVNVLNGLLDVNTGELQAHSPDFLSPVQLPVTFDPTAEPTAWIRFVSQVFPEDCRELPWQLAAWLMVPDVNIQKAVLLLGAGGNGKSRFLKALGAFVGEQNTVPLSLQKLAGNPFAAARLVGKLANICTDLPSAHLADTSLFKALTGGDDIDVERKYETGFTYNNFARLLFSANHPPQSSDSSSGFFRRWLVVPFEAQFEPGDENYIPEQVLDAMLADPQELSGVLNKALEYRARVNDEGIPETPSMRAAWYELKEVTNPIEVWFEQNLIEDANAQVEKGVLLRAYNQAAQNDGRL